MILLQATTSTLHQNNFFDISTLTTLGGATIAVLLVCNAAQSIFNFNPKWFSAVISLIISFALAYHDQSNQDSLKYLIAFFNGLLIWSTAVGGNTLTAKNNNDSGSFTAQMGSKRSFNEKWS